MKVRPLNDRIIVRQLAPATSSSGGILLTNTEEKVVQGQVVAIGQGRALKSGKVVDFTVKYGDVVVFDKDTATKARVEGEELFVLREEDILALVE